jgi:hypothetical protein
MACFQLTWIFDVVDPTGILSFSPKDEKILFTSATRSCIMRHGGGKRYDDSMVLCSHASSPPDPGFHHPFFS